MGMKKKALKAAGYAVAPKLSMLARHPGKAALLKAGAMAGGMAMDRLPLDRMMPDRFRPRPKRTSLGMAARGLGAAAVAAPLGWWLGRKILGGEAARQSA